MTNDEFAVREKRTLTKTNRKTTAGSAKCTATVLWNVRTALETKSRWSVCTAITADWSRQRWHSWGENLASGRWKETLEFKGYLTSGVQHFISIWLFKQSLQTLWPANKNVEKRLFTWTGRWHHLLILCAVNSQTPPPLLQRFSLGTDFMLSIHVSAHCEMSGCCEQIVHRHHTVCIVCINLLQNTVLQMKRVHVTFIRSWGFYAPQRRVGHLFWCVRWSEDWTSLRNGRSVMFFVQPVRKKTWRIIFWTIFSENKNMYDDSRLQHNEIYCD